MKQNTPMKQNMIVKGYNGVMDLDLSLVPENVRKIAIDQHFEDIAEYNAYQASLPPSLRYENTICKISKQLKLEEKHVRLRNEKEVHDIQKRDKDRIDSYYLRYPKSQN
tara:strand:+ start:4946 stop:5272 length:327 start_codon:yes stop_codon:yes gene_type:complete